VDQKRPQDANFRGPTIAREPKHRTDTTAKQQNKPNGTGTQDGKASRSRRSRVQNTAQPPATSQPLRRSPRIAARQKGRGIS
jgi:hypothetical protein